MNSIPFTAGKLSIEWHEGSLAC